MVKIKPHTSELIKARRSPVHIKEERLNKVNYSSPPPVIVDAEKPNKEVISEIPRPPNAFMIFAAEWRKKLAVEHPGKIFFLHW